MLNSRRARRYARRGLATKVMARYGAVVILVLGSRHAITAPNRQLQGGRLRRVSPLRKRHEIRDASPVTLHSVEAIHAQTPTITSEDLTAQPVNNLDLSAGTDRRSDNSGHRRMIHRSWRHSITLHGAPIP
jgi:hypothetical protein